MKKIVRLTENDLTRIVKKVIKEQEDIDFDVDNSRGFGSTYDSVGDYRADIYGDGRMFDPYDYIDRDFNEDEWDEGEEYDNVEDFEQSPFYNDKKNRWSNTRPGNTYFDQEKESRGGRPLKIRRRR